MKLNGKKKYINMCLLIGLIIVILIITVCLFHKKEYKVYGEYGLFKYNDEQDTYELGAASACLITDNSVKELLKVSKKIIAEKTNSDPGWGEGVMLYICEKNNQNNKKRLIYQYSCDDGKLYYHNGEEWSLVIKGEEQVSKIVSNWCISRYSLKNHSECNPKNHVYLPYSFFIENFYHTRAYEIDEYFNYSESLNQQINYSNGPFENRLANGCHDEKEAAELVMKELGYDEANMLWYYNRFDGSWRIDLIPIDLKYEKTWTLSDYSKLIKTAIVSQDGEIKAIYQPNYNDIGVFISIPESPGYEKYFDEGVIVTVSLKQKTS